MRKRTIAAALFLAMAVIAGCGSNSAKDITIIGGADGPTSIFLAGKVDSGTYTQIDQETAKQMMELDDGHVLVDTRRQDEFDAGHIPGAICIPNENITDTMVPELPDLDQVILIYCRTGRRSKEAAQKLADIGYTNVYEMGGITDWTGEVVTD